MIRNVPAPLGEDTEFVILGPWRSDFGSVALQAFERARHRGLPEAVFVVYGEPTMIIYWRDPWGQVFEHWTDGDLFTADDAPNVASLKDLVSAQWGKPIFAS